MYRIFTTIGYYTFTHDFYLGSHPVEWHPSIPCNSWTDASFSGYWGAILGEGKCWYTAWLLG